ncbi:hypothetical protein BHE74_00009046, partial [Ensete ventricosum]
VSRSLTGSSKGQKKKKRKKKKQLQRPSVLVFFQPRLYEKGERSSHRETSTSPRLTLSQTSAVHGSHWEEASLVQRWDPLNRVRGTHEKNTYLRWPYHSTRRCRSRRDVGRDEYFGRGRGHTRRPAGTPERRRTANRARVEGPPDVDTTATAAAAPKDGAPCSSSPWAT